MAKGHKKTRNTVIVLILLLLAAGVYMLTGYDPLGLFEEPTPVPSPTPTIREVPSPIPAAEDWWQVYFTDPNNVPLPEDPDETVPAGSVEEQLIRNIQKAQSSIHIASFEFNLTPVAEALIEAHKRGVEVQWVTDDEHGIEADEEDDHGQFAMLEDAGIVIKDDGRGALMHNKFWIFDQQVLWSGSTNITQNGMFKNNNNVIIIESPELAAIYEREFQEMWTDGAYGPKSPSTVDQQKLTLNDTPIQVLFAAEDEAVSHLAPLIKGARKSIRFMAFSFTHDDLGAAVLAQAQAGVDTKGIFETRGSETDYSELPRLYCAGVPVRQDGNKRTFHHKTFILDDRIVVTGSLNFSNNADDSNDENVLIIENEEIAARYLEEFARRWAEAKDPDAEDMECAAPVQQAAQQAEESNDAADCKIKGNISSKKKKLYYLPTDPNYNRVKIDLSKGERWFCSEEEAQQAGWTHNE